MAAGRARGRLLPLTLHSSLPFEGLAMPVKPSAVPASALPLVSFLRLIESARPPQRADRSALGTLPTRASRYCDAVTAASAFGYYLFSPMDFSLLWDGADIFWTYAGTDRWLPLQAAQFPNFSRRFDEQAPAELAGCAPPFLSALPEPGTVQLWTGLIARTAPDWSLLLRPVVNLPSGSGFVPFEGIIETDRWFGPLFTNLRLTRTNTPVQIHADTPLVQAQPLPRALYEDATLDRMTHVRSMDDFTAADWEGYRQTIVVPNADPDRPFGQYAVQGRRRRRCPMAPDAMAAVSAAQ